MGQPSAFGPNAATGVSVINASTITAISPPGIGTVDVVVTTPGGSSPLTSADLFCYKQNTTTTLTATPNPSPFGQPVTLTSTVVPSSATGTVTFFDGAEAIGTAPLVNGTAVFVTSSFAVGKRSLTAVYSGDSNHFASTSPVVILKVITAHPPIDVKGFQRANKFATQTGYVNFLEWKAPRKGTPIVAYQIYRDRALNERIAKISSDEHLRFQDHNRKKGKTYTYFIVSIDQFGNISKPAEVKVRD